MHSVINKIISNHLRIPLMHWQRHYLPQYLCFSFHEDDTLTCIPWNRLWSPCKIRNHSRLSFSFAIFLFLLANLLLPGAEPQDLLSSWRPSSPPFCFWWFVCFYSLQSSTGFTAITMLNDYTSFYVIWEVMIILHLQWRSCCYSRTPQMGDELLSNERKCIIKVMKKKTEQYERMTWKDNWGINNMEEKTRG